jgi:putative two-component system response regulator
LIVDDEWTSRETLQSILEGDEYNLEMAENGVDGLEKARKYSPDVILLDVMMPGMTGYEVCKAIRADVAVAEIPIIMVTALDDHSSMLRGLEVGADDFITKPFDRFELRARLMGITRLNRYRKLVEERAGLEAAHQQLKKAYDETITGWSRAMDLRDKETEGHTQRVAEMTVQLAIKMGVSEDNLEHVRRGALLHDIGKLGVPDGILLKPGDLTEEEWISMRRHPAYAREMLDKIEYLHPALDIPVYHHEKWDGSGYPSGLKGEQIPLAARLFAIVDVWDALLSDRPYRPAWSKKKTIAHIKAESGKHFDPRIVEIFIELYGQP